MKSSHRKIGISLRIVKAENYDEQRDALSHDWVLLLENLGFHPILIPNSLSDLELFLKDLELDGLILSGGDNIGDTPIRDNVEREIINYSIKEKIPLIGVCRGMQILNQYFSGAVTKTNSQDHVNIHHNLRIIHPQFSNFLTDSINVNSFHKNLITQEILGKDLKSFANYERDNTVEGFFHIKYPILGVMWHPERENNSITKLIINKIFLLNKFWD